jgi:hypothetical protein
MAAITFHVDDRQVQAALRHAEDGLDQFVERAAEELAKNAAVESAGASSRLGDSPWPVSNVSPVGATVTAPEFFAHFLARGTQAHGPAYATRLVFEGGGGTVFARFVSGIDADPFDERAAAATEAQLDDLLGELVL